VRRGCIDPGLEREGLPRAPDIPPAEHRRQRPAGRVERDQAVPEARDGVGLCPAEDVAREPHHLVRVVAAVLRAVQLAGRSACSSNRCARTEDEPTSSASTVATRRIYPEGEMAVVIASNLRKELAGSVLFDAVSFSVERRDRVALSGPNGAGKTTLLRMISGETERHGGELAFQKGTRVALHDQRPPLEQGHDAA